MRMFRCVEIEGTSWLVADMRLQCYTSEWTGCVVGAPCCASPDAHCLLTCACFVVMSDRYALYALACGIVYVVGFPLSVFVLLFRRRQKLFGYDTDPVVATTRAKYGFLYEVREPGIGVPMWLASISQMPARFNGVTRWSVV